MGIKRVKKESNGPRKKIDKRLAEGRKDSLLKAIDELKEQVMEYTNRDEATMENTLIKWTGKEGSNVMGIKGSRQLHDGTTFSLEALESMAATLQLWLMCRLFNHWSKTKMSEKTAPYDLSLNVAVDFGEEDG